MGMQFSRALRSELLLLMLILDIFLGMLLFNEANS